MRIVISSTGSIEWGKPRNSSQILRCTEIGNYMAELDSPQLVSMIEVRSTQEKGNASKAIVIICILQH